MEVEVAVLVILDVIETERGTEILTGIILEFLLQGEMNPFHHEVEVGVNVEEGVVEVTGVRDRGPVRGAHREEGTVMIDSYFHLLGCL